ncbi:acetylserotonin O-methyltransferase-like isoform X5 [Mastomys coucha]|uniref:acetylserotonin O-methyltransferase-like isoform X5 n=1 Tax=Mastomys coucha TaxID=35658 RepID=UPI00126242F7|nr:acetylserotonin O-methyltransferase-like isoform X5 [Mastomys coucha]
MASAEPGPGRGGRGVAARARATRARDRAFRVLMDHAHGFMASQVTPGPRGPHPLMACVTSDPTPSPAGVVRGLRAWRLRRPGRAGRGGRRGRGGGRELRPPGNAAAHGRLRGARAAEGGAGRLFLQHRTGVRLPGDGQPPVSARDAALPRGHDVPLLGAPGGRGKAGTSTRGPWASPLSKTHSPPSTGDFFRSRLPRADLFILARVLHDWTDGACVRLLRRAGGACGAGGAVLVVEAALAGGGAERGRALLLSLNMLLQTRGRERSGAEYRALAARAGFPRLRLRRPGGPYAAMLARK